MTNLKNLGLNFQDKQTFYKVHLNPRRPLVLLNVECERNMLECIVLPLSANFGQATIYTSTK